MADRELDELRDHFHGLVAVVGMALSMMDKDTEIFDRLQAIEQSLRQANAPSGTIETVMYCRRVFDPRK